MLKTCSECGYTGLNFEATRKQCKKCRKKYLTKYRKNNKKKIRDQQVEKKYGLLPDEFDSILKQQGGGCKTCGYSSPKHHLSIDHCHKTGVVRGLLCPWCNLALGYVKDDAKILANLIVHLLEAQNG